MLKNIAVRGEVYCEYAYLSYDMSFENTLPKGTLAEYIFSLPQNAVISELKIIYNNKRIINTTVVSVSHATRMWEISASGAVLNRIDKTTYMLRFGAIDKGECHIRLRVYVPIPKRNDEKVLTIPLARESYGGERCTRFARISLVLHGDFKDGLKYSSPTHKLEEDRMGRNIEVSTGEIAADRDFSLRIIGIDNKSSAVVTRGKTGGSILCRLYPDKELFEQDKKDYKQLLLIYDGTGSLMYGASRAGRELLLAIVKSFGGRFMVITAAEKPKMLTDGFCECNDENISRLTKELSGELCAGGSLSGTVEYAKNYITEETLPILISGTKFSGGLPSSGPTDTMADIGFCAVTLGAMAESAELDEFVKSCGGIREHIFGNDGISERASEILQRFRGVQSRRIEAYADGERAVVLNDGDYADGGVTVFAQFSGDTVPKGFSLRCSGTEQTFVLENVLLYQSFAPVQLAYAGYISSQLQKRLEICSPCEIQKLRMELEEIGIKYSYINSETALVAVFEGTKTEAIRTIVSDSGCRAYEVFEGRASAFSEVDEDMRRGEIVALCTDIIIRSMRSDGAICAVGEANPDIRKQQTLVCLLALVAAGVGEEYYEFMTIAKKYLGDYSYGEIKYTENSGLAKELMRGIFGEREPLPYGFVPDLLTAARMIAQK